MSNRYNRNRKLQSTPKFCFRKKPIVFRMIPCEHGPSIGETVKLIMYASRPVAGHAAKKEISTNLTRTPNTTAYATSFTDRDGFHWGIGWQVDCPHRAHVLIIGTDDPAFSLQPWTSLTMLFPPTQKNCDTRWFDLFTTPPINDTWIRARIYL